MKTCSSSYQQCKTYIGFRKSNYCMSTEDIPQRLHVNREWEGTRVRLQRDSNKGLALIMSKSNNNNNNNWFCFFYHVKTQQFIILNISRSVRISQWKERSTSGTYIYAWKGDQVEHLLCLHHTWCLCPQVIDPSRPALKNYKQLLKKLAEWVQGYQPCCRLPGRILWLVQGYHV